MGAVYGDQYGGDQAKIKANCCSEEYLATPGSYFDIECIHYWDTKIQGFDPNAPTRDINLCDMAIAYSQHGGAFGNNDTILGGRVDGSTGFWFMHLRNMDIDNCVV